MNATFVRTAWVVGVVLFLATMVFLFVSARSLLTAQDNYKVAFESSKTREARYFDVPATIALRIKGTTAERQAAIRLLLSEVTARLGASATLDEGKVSIVIGLGGKAYVVEFAVIFPVATLDGPDFSTVHLASWIVRVPRRWTSDSEVRARSQALELLGKQIDDAIAPGTPLAGQVAVVYPKKR